MPKGNSFNLHPFVKDNKVTKKVESDEYIISKELRDKYIPQNDGVVVEKEVVITGKVNRKEYIQSFFEEVELSNILRKFEETGDEELINQTHRLAGRIADDGKEEIVDYTGVPTSPEEAAVVIQKGRQLFAQVPEELKSNRSFVDFVEQCDDAQVKAYLKAVIEKQEVKVNE